ncbi:dienelactone hydrolase family protein [Enemella evansiae]|uniref:dienelactone hydrolase family protein n=1 Tax=Enemella evansiae TaxID=2016499 RepID=UPI00105B98D1|nr:dienelactone hydrolase family protein [Enemella evansiae]TDO93501.1 carboxymethylenebutenolidase [Enemella evansiae]
MPTAQQLQIAMPDGGVCDALLAGPERPASGLLLIPDIFGLRPQIAAMAERLSNPSRAVLAVNPFWRRRGSPLIERLDLTTEEGRGKAFQNVMPLANATPLSETVADAGTWLEVLADTGAKRLAVTGYCRGGVLALAIAAGHPDRIAAAGVFHAGKVVTDAADSPHLGVGTVRGELLFRHADDDPNMTPAQQEQLGAALTTAGVRFDQQTYPGAPHGYTMADTWAYHQESAEQHYTELEDLLQRNGI